MPSRSGRESHVSADRSFRPENADEIPALRSASRSSRAGEGSGFHDRHHPHAGAAIGANSAIFTLVNAALVRPLGFQDPERLMLIYESIPGSGRDRFGVSPADYIDLLQYQHSFSNLGAYRTTTVELSGGGEPEQVDAATITSSLFDVLGVKAAEGRTFLADEDQSQPSVAIISHSLATRHFAGRSAVGGTIAIDRQPFTVVGVMPAGFEFPRRGASSNATPADVWMPLVFTPSQRQARGSGYNLSVIGRLREGTPPAQAAADLSVLATRIRDNYPADLQIGRAS